MRLMPVFATCLLLASSGAAWAQTPAGNDAAPAPAEGTPAGPRDDATGDAWIDRQLADMAVYAGRYPGAFTDELVRYHAAPRALVEPLLDDPSWPAGQVYYACALAHVAGRPCRAAVDARQAGSDWAEVADTLGVTATATARKRLRAAIEASYGHWARPLAEPGRTPANGDDGKSKARAGGTR